MSVYAYADSSECDGDRDPQDDREDGYGCDEFSDWDNAVEADEEEE